MESPEAGSTGYGQGNQRKLKMSGAGWWRGVRVVGKGLCLVPGYWEGAGGFGLTPELLFLWGGQWVVESGGGCCIGSSGGVSVCLVQFKLSCEVAFVNSLDGGREGVSQG